MPIYIDWYYWCIRGGKAFREDASAWFVDGLNEDNKIWILESLWSCKWRDVVRRLFGNNESNKKRIKDERMSDYHRSRPVGRWGLPACTLRLSVISEVRRDWSVQAECRRRGTNCKGAPIGPFLSSWDFERLKKSSLARRNFHFGSEELHYFDHLSLSIPLHCLLISWLWNDNGFDLECLQST